MSREYWFMAALSVTVILLLILCCPRGKLRESLFLFLAAQAATWPLTILAVFRGLLKSPVRLFPKATDSNFLIAFVFLPTVFTAYYWQYPRNSSRILQITYSLIFAAAVTMVHVAIQKYSDLLRYITFSGYKLWPVIIVLFYLLRIYADWYFRQLAKARSGSAP